MERFFFHIEYGEYQRDMEGSLLPNERVARVEAVKMVGRLLEDEADAFWDKPAITVTVTDEWGLTLWNIEVQGAASAVRRLKRP
jgi:hypothetical protein